MHIIIFVCLNLNVHSTILFLAARGLEGEYSLCVSHLAWDSFLKVVEFVWLVSTKSYVKSKLNFETASKRVAEADRY